MRPTRSSMRCRASRSIFMAWAVAAPLRWQRAKPADGRAFNPDNGFQAELIPACAESRSWFFGIKNREKLALNHKVRVRFVKVDLLSRRFGYPKSKSAIGWRHHRSMRPFMGFPIQARFQMYLAESGRSVVEARTSKVAIQKRIISLNECRKLSGRVTL
jgi:hypothetical protein